MTEHTIEISGEHGRYGWACTVCNWAGLGLTSEDGCRREHEQVAKDIRDGRLEPGGIEPKVITEDVS